MPVPGSSTRPVPARVYEVWLGGGVWHDADRAMADAVEAQYPPPQAGRLPVVREMAVDDKAFTLRAAGWAAEAGTGQFLVLGAGLPGRRRQTGAGNVHDAAGDGRTVYVSRDPLIVSHAAALTAGLPRVFAAEGDFADPPAVLAMLADGGLLDMARPAAVILPRSLNFVPAAKARNVTGAYMAAMAPGSCLIVSCGRCDPPQGDPELWERVRAAYSAAEIWNHTRAEAESFFAGTRLVPPGVTLAAGWRPGWGSEARPDTAGYVLGGAGVKR